MLSRMISLLTKTAAVRGWDQDFGEALVRDERFASMLRHPLARPHPCSAQEYGTKRVMSDECLTTRARATTHTPTAIALLAVYCC